jgi:uncharacterized membrane protein YtjA (UPF0391 family)
MIGWMMIFALMALLSAAVDAAAGPGAASISLKVATAIFSVLFCACVVTSVVRRRA